MKQTESVVAIALLSVCLAMAVIVGCDNSKTVDNGNNVWIERGRIKSGDWWINGPVVLRRKDGPLFFVHEASNELLKLNREIPFVVVLEVPDSMKILSEIDPLRTGEWGTDPETVASFRMLDGQVVNVVQWFEPEDDVNGDLLGVNCKVRVGCLVDESDEDGKEFDQKNGRVICVKYDDSNGVCHVEQLDVELPQTDVLFGIDARDVANYGLMHRWWNAANGQ